MRAFTSQKGPGKGLPASGFAPERRESPEFPRAPQLRVNLVARILFNVRGSSTWLEDFSTIVLCHCNQISRVFSKFF